MPELTITSPYVPFRVDSAHLTWATLCQSRLYPPVRNFGFGQWLIILRITVWIEVHQKEKYFFLVQLQTLFDKIKQ